MRSVITFAAAALFAGTVVPRFVQQMSKRTQPQAHATGSPAAANPDISNSYSVEVPRDAFGRFRVEGRIEGQRLDFMVDTGASVVALTAQDSAMLGIHPAESDYTIALKTANGVVHAAPTTLSVLEVGNIMLHNVAAVVMPEGALSDNLLGMSFLSRLHHFDYSDGKMVLRE